MLEDESEETKAIVAFVKKTSRDANPPYTEEYGPQYREIRDRKHFPWGQDKWSKNWKRAKVYLEKKQLPTGGYPRYFVRKDLPKEDINVLSLQRIASQISRQGSQVQEIKIPWLRLEQAVGKHVEKLRPMFEDIAWDEGKKKSEEGKKAWEAKQAQRKGKSGLLQQIKRTITKKKSLKEQFGGLLDETGHIDETHPLVAAVNLFKYQDEAATLHQHEMELGLLKLATHAEINVVYDKNEPLPILEDDDIVNLLYILARNVKARIKKPWSIVVTCSIPEEHYKKDRSILENSENPLRLS